MEFIDSPFQLIIIMLNTIMISVQMMNKTVSITFAVIQFIVAISLNILLQVSISNLSLMKIHGYIPISLILQISSFFAFCFSIFKLKDLEFN